MPQCATAISSIHSSVRLHDPAGPTALCLHMVVGEAANTVHLELSNGSGIPLASGVADRFQLFSLLASKRDIHAGLAGLGLRFDAKSGRIWLSSDEFGAASLLFMRRWELQDGLNDLYKVR